MPYIGNKPTESDRNRNTMNQPTDRTKDWRTGIQLPAAENDWNRNDSINMTNESSSESYPVEQNWRGNNANTNGRTVNHEADVYHSSESSASWSERSNGALPKKDHTGPQPWSNALSISGFREVPSCNVTPALPQQAKASYLENLTNTPLNSTDDSYTTQPVSASQFKPASTSQFNPVPAPQFISASAPNYNAGTTSQYNSEPTSQYNSEPTSQYNSEPTSQYNSEPTSQCNSEPTSQYNSEPTSQYNSEPTSQRNVTLASQFDPQPTPQFFNPMPNSRVDISQNPVLSSRAAHLSVDEPYAGHPRDRSSSGGSDSKSAIDDLFEKAQSKGPILINAGAVPEPSRYPMSSVNTPSARIANLTGQRFDTSYRTDTSELVDGHQRTSSDVIGLTQASSSVPNRTNIVTSGYDRQTFANQMSRNNYVGSQEPFNLTSKGSGFEKFPTSAPYRRSEPAPDNYQFDSRSSQNQVEICVTIVLPKHCMNNSYVVLETSFWSQDCSRTNWFWSRP